MITRLFNRLFENELVRRVVKNSGYLFSATGISAALSMLQGILIARLLGVAGYGILGTITTFTSVVNKFASFRMGELVVKYVGQYTEAGDRPRAAAVFKAAALVEFSASIFAFGLIWLLAPLGARYFAKDPAMADWFVLYGLIVIANLITESSIGLLQIFDRFRRMAVLNVFQSLVTLSIITFVYVTGGGFFGILLAYLTGKAIGALGMTGVALVEATRRWGWGWWGTSLSLLRGQRRELAHFAISTNLSASLSLINKDSELLWVSLLRNPVETGYYKLALALANIVQLPINPLPHATYPELSREVARRNWNNVRYVLRQGSILAGGYTLAASLGLLFFGRWVIRTFYNPEYLPAYPAVLILLVGFLLANTFYWNRTALLAIGHPDFPTKVNLVLAVLKVIGVLLLVPRFGYLASASLLAGSYLLGVSVSVLKFRREVSRQEQLAAV
ncbi:MAG TPA: oligosaccharide flippase family protein [Anaerolineales bacterium]|nr:oligosaccharide flippase family protein [Anaerolineales bacterium]